MITLPQPRRLRRKIKHVGQRVDIRLSHQGETAENSAWLPAAIHLLYRV
jgi:hypothetical protein